MAQISLYIDDAMVPRLNAAAKARNWSISKYVATVISEFLSKEEADEAKKKKLLIELQGAIDDPTFVEPQDIPWEAEMPRRFDLI
ncbi:MAG: hypothetical protein FWF85_03585 [Clostridiales bacterium]|jgi:predicted transcriptional regulator|nr:hypothetical protein [Clostridiales bacterium]MDR2712616.1 hypothetical protein [Clostridiales bacterium]